MVHYFIKDQSSFTYVIKNGTIGIRVFSITEHKACVGLFEPTIMGLPFKSFAFDTFMTVSLLFCNTAR